MGLLPMAYSALFLINPQTAAQERPCPQWAGPAHTSLIFSDVSMLVSRQTDLQHVIYVILQVRTQRLKVTPYHARVKAH